MDDIIGLVLQQIGNIAPLLLGYNPAYTLDVLHHHFPLFIREIGKSLVGSNSRIGEKPYDELPIFGSLIDDIDDSRMDDIPGDS
jgi:hypothetical protein